MALSAGHEKLALGDVKISAYLNEMRILRIFLKKYFKKILF